MMRSWIVFQQRCGCECREERAALRIQAVWRKYVLRREYLEFRRGVVLVQSAWRRRRARRELRRLRQEAREATKLLQDKRSLEEKVAELQNVLEVVQNQRNELKQQYKVCVHPDEPASCTCILYLMKELLHE